MQPSPPLPQVQRARTRGNHVSPAARNAKALCRRGFEIAGRRQPQPAAWSWASLRGIPVGIRGWRRRQIRPRRRDAVSSRRQIRGRDVHEIRCRHRAGWRFRGRCRRWRGHGCYGRLNRRRGGRFHRGRRRSSCCFLRFVRNGGHVGLALPDHGFVLAATSQNRQGRKCGDFVIEFHMCVLAVWFPLRCGLSRRSGPNSPAYFRGERGALGPSDNPQSPPWEPAAFRNCRPLQETLVSRSKM